MMQPADQAVLLGEVISFHAQRTPQAPALVFQSQQTSYRELNENANRVANGLLHWGFQPSDRIAYLGMNSTAYFELLFGSARASTVLVGINWRLAAPEIQFILKDAEVRCLFVEPSFLELARTIIGDCPQLDRLIVLSEQPGEVGYTEWLSQQSTEPVPDAGNADDVVMQMYTSGTTGMPKGVLIAHRGFFAQMRAASACGDWAQWHNDDVGLLAMPAFHIGGTMWGFTALYQGSSHIVLPAPDVDGIIDAIAQHKVTKMFIVPALLMMIVNSPKARESDLASMRVIIYGASPISETVLEQSLKLFSNAAFVQQYGMTEAAGAICALSPQDHIPGSRRMKSCGTAYPGAQIKVVSTDRKELPPLETGEVIVKIDSIMCGYWNRPEDTEKALRDGWYHSGDAGYLDEDGFLYIQDRIKDMIVSGGENIYPAEIENVLHKHEDILDVAVIGVPDDKWGEAVRAVIVRRPGSDLQGNDVITFGREHIAGYKLPKTVDFVEQLPRNTAGKLLKHVLRAEYWKGHDRAVN